MTPLNKNDNPLLEIDKTIHISDFDEIKYFNKIAVLTGSPEEEKLVVKEILDERYSFKKNVLYIIVIKDYIQKIGSSTNSMKDRIRSYNCGKKEYRKQGTCSTTNFFVLQTLLQINEDIEIYGFYPETKEQEFDCFGELIEIEVSVPSKTYEKNILEKLKTKGKMPALCTQT